MNLQVTGNFVHIDERTLYWLAGLLEGEGSFVAPNRSAPNKPAISLVSTDEDVVAKVAELLGVTYNLSCPDRCRRNNWKLAFHVVLRGRRAVELMRILHPLMSARRRQQIEKALSTYTPPRAPHLNEAQGMSLAKRYYAGERKPTALGREFGISKNLAIYYIQKYAAVAQG